MHCNALPKIFAACLLLSPGVFAFNLNVDTTTYMVGESAVYRVSGAPANATIYWSSWLNGASTGEVNVSYGQTTDAKGNWVVLAGTWQTAHVGSWVKQALIGGQSVQVSFQVTPRLTMGKTVFNPGDTPTYTISGAPANSPILWSSWKNGSSTGEVDTDYGQVTDSNGNWSATAGSAWASGDAATWIKQASINGVTTQITFQVLPSALNTYQQKAGIYDGRQTSYADGASRITAIGGRTARFVLLPACGSTYSALDMASAPDFVAAITNPSLDTVSVHVFDVTSYCDATHIYVDPNLYIGSVPAAVQQELSDLTLYLYRKFHDTGKRFYISNWEGDNAVYCESAYDYVTDSNFRDTCNSGYPTNYRGMPGPTAALSGIQLWFQNRQTGVNAGRSQAQSEGIANVTVYNAPEISTVNLLRDAGFGSVLWNVLPNLTGIDVVSYSSYESLNATPNTLQTDIATIRSASGVQKIMIGELGYSQADYSDPNQLESRTSDALNAAFAANVEHTFAWVLSDNNQFGLFNPSFVEQPIGYWYASKYAGQ